MFDSPLPTDTTLIVNEFIASCEEYKATQSDADQASMDGQQYTIIQVEDPNTKKALRHKTAEAIREKLSLRNAASVLFKVPSGRYKFVWYPFGGSTQSKGGRILRSAWIDWINEDADVGVEEDPRLDAGNIATSSDTVSVLTTLLARSEARASMTMDRMMGQVERLIDTTIKTTESHGNQLARVMDAYMGHGAAAMRDARDETREAHDMRVSGMRMETAAVLAERRAKLTAESAEAMLEDAERSLEEGNRQGWERVLQMLISMPGGDQILGGLVGRVLTIVDEKILGNKDPAIKSMAFGDLAQIAARLELTPDQMQKAGAMMAAATKNNTTK